MSWHDALGFRSVSVLITEHGQRLPLLCIESAMDITAPHGKAKRHVTRNSEEHKQIRRAQAGDPRAFETLYHRHKRRVMSICWKMVHNATEAEDLAQQAFLQLFRKIHTYRGESAFTTWLHRLTVNIVLMSLRTSHNDPEVPFDELGSDEGEIDVQSQFGEGDSRLHGSLDRVLLERAIQLLPPGYRIVFILHDVEGYEHNEIAEILGCSIGNSKSQLHKARLKLRKCLHAGNSNGRRQPCEQQLAVRARSQPHSQLLTTV